MAAHGAADAAAVPLRPAPRGRSGRGRECDPLHRGYGMPVARAAEGFSTVFDGSVLLLHMAWIGLMALGQRRFGPMDARKTRAQAQSFRRHHRQSDCEDHGKWRPTRI